MSKKEEIKQQYIQQYVDQAPFGYIHALLVAAAEESLDKLDEEGINNFHELIFPSKESTKSEE